MSKNQKNLSLTTEDGEIDFVKLIQFFYRKRLSIIYTTLVITLLAASYALFLKKSVYKSTFLIEIGSYKTLNEEKKLEEPSDLANKLKFLFVPVGDEADLIPRISSIQVFSNKLIAVKALGYSEEEAETELDKVSSYVEERHKNLLNEVKQANSSTINPLKAVIKNLENKTQLSTSITEFKNELVNFLYIHREVFYKKTSVIGDINTKKLPKKVALIIASAFFGSFIFSLFLLLLINFFKGIEFLEE